jgi:hypothetical protein
VRKVVTKILGVFLFMVFLAGIMPKEYIHHALFDHEDDVHPVYKAGEVVITKKHNHCSFLSFEFAPFLVQEPQFLKFKELVVFTGFILPVVEFSFYSLPHVVSLRGPPSMGCVAI